MARPNPRLIQALRETAARIADGADYRWTHMGRCNCGQLAQTLTGLDAAELHRRALERAGDWSQQAIEYCPTSGLPIDHVFQTLESVGLSMSDLAKLERLADREVRHRLGRTSSLDHRARADVVDYFEAWADLLEERLGRVEQAAKLWQSQLLEAQKPREPVS